jgi:hypothetical protein
MGIFFQLSESPYKIPTTITKAVKDGAPDTPVNLRYVNTCPIMRVALSVVDGWLNLVSGDLLTMARPGNDSQSQQDSSHRKIFISRCPHFCIRDLRKCACVGWRHTMYRAR